MKKGATIISICILISIPSFTLTDAQIKSIIAGKKYKGVTNTSIVTFVFEKAKNSYGAAVENKFTHYRIGEGGWYVINGGYLVLQNVYTRRITAYKIYQVSPRHLILITSSGYLRLYRDFSYVEQPETSPGN